MSIPIVNANYTNPKLPGSSSNDPANQAGNAPGQTSTLSLTVPKDSGTGGNSSGGSKQDQIKSFAQLLVQNGVITGDEANSAESFSALLISTFNLKSGDSINFNINANGQLTSISKKNDNGQDTQLLSSPAAIKLAKLLSSGTQSGIKEANINELLKFAENQKPPAQIIQLLLASS